MNARAVAAGFAIFACGCATQDDPYRLNAERSGAGIEMPPYAMREECFALEPNDRIAWHFASTAPVAFNIHYHDGNAVVEPVSRAHAKEDSGELVADRKQTYCMMWEAGAESALIDYGVRRLPRR
jgi:hypothetical protein